MSSLSPQNYFREYSYILFGYREEIETPKVWAQICIQRMVELAEESTTLRLVVDPMFVYFDSRQHWVSQQGLAMVVLSDMSYWEASGRFVTVFILLKLPNMIRIGNFYDFAC